MTLLTEIVGASSRVGATAARREKVRELAALLRRLNVDEIDTDLQASVRYPGGLALRLARVKRYRDDKRVEDADTMDAVRKIYAAQSGRMPAGSTGVIGEISRG